jgi:cell division protease FtsH
MVLEHAYPLLKVTIVPREYSGFRLCAIHPQRAIPVQYRSVIRPDLYDAWRAGSGGIIFGKISTGASNDLQQITKMAYSMITVYGMNEKIGNISYYDLLKTILLPSLLARKP